MNTRRQIILGLALFSVLSTRLSTAHARDMTLPGKTNQTQTVPWDQVGAKAGVDYEGDVFMVTSTADAARLHCIYQRLDGQATTGGLWLTSTVRNQVSDDFQVKAVWLGRNGIVSALSDKGTVSVDEQRICFERAGLVEEYTAGIAGVRQDFVVTGKPAGPGELVVGLAVAGAQAEATMDGVRLVLIHSGRKIAYSRLRVMDATGKELPARLEVASQSTPRTSHSAVALAVVVNDAGAVYPVRIDPTFTDANWISLPGADGTVVVAAVDGQGNLYIGGAFQNVGNTSAPYIAKWNGRAWSCLGLGMDNVVEALAFSADGSVYASGAFLTATNSDGTPVTVNGIAKWDGSQWSPLGAGVTDGVDGFFFVDALAVSGSNVYAGGYFTAMGGVTAYYIAQWNGSTWAAVGSGTDDIVHTLTIFGGNLYAGGSFTIPALYIARWDGTSWSAVGGGLDYGVNGLAVCGTNLYVGGNFQNAFNTNGTVPAAYVAKWNGSEWSALGPGMNNTVDTVAVAGGTLYAGGIFTMAGGVLASNIAQWDGSNWSALGSGTIGIGGANDVRTLATSGTILYAGGNFTEAGGAPANHIAAGLLAWPDFQGSPVRNADGSITLNVATLTQNTSRLYAASNLTPPISWQPIYTNVTGGLWQFTDTNTAAFSSKFYVLSMP